MLLAGPRHRAVHYNVDQLLVMQSTSRDCMPDLAMRVLPNFVVVPGQTTGDTGVFATVKHWVTTENNRIFLAFSDLAFSVSHFTFAISKSPFTVDGEGLRK